MSDPSEYLKIKYSAPPGACKCGNCQLVPPEKLAQWASIVEQYRVDAARDEKNNATLRAQLAKAHAALEQAQDCIRGETPEDMTHEEAREDTISKIREVLLTDDLGKK